MRLIAVIGVFFVWQGSLGAGVAQAQTEEELDAARKLFVEALGDQEAGRTEEALGKFERVRDVKDTAPVRFRIASCLETLGRKQEAIENFDKAAELGKDDEQYESLVSEARARAGALRAESTTLSIQVPPEDADQAEVYVDGERIQKEQLDAPVEVSPGPHVVEAKAPGKKPFRREINVKKGSNTSMVVAMLPAERDGLPPIDGEAAEKKRKTKRLIGWIGVGVGAALILGGVVSLAVREGDISELESSCPGGQCPRSREAELSSTRDEAKMLGPLGGVLIGVGAVSAGVGTYFLLTSREPKNEADKPSAGIRIGPTGLSLVGRF